MKALILAAGLGTRLAPLTNDRPKSLVAVNGQPILLKQIENLKQNEVEEIIIVSGYKGDILRKTVLESYPDVQILQNNEYADTNNMYSAYLGKELLGGSDFLMMNADVFFDASVITALLKYEGENAIVTDIGTYLEESMKVVEEGGRLLQISKAIKPEEALGASIDVYKFTKSGGEAFFRRCEEYIEKRRERGLWSEVALNDILTEIEFKACPLEGRWLEIDTLEDLAAAERLFAQE